MVNSGSNKRPFQADSDQEEHDMKRQATSGTVQFRILVPNARAGSVLGKGGDVIAKLRADTDARIKMEDRVTGCDERVVTVSSPDTNSTESDEYCPAQLALFRVIQKVIEAADPESTPLARMLVPQGQVGALVGKSGSIISGFRERTGATIRVLGNTDVPLCALPGEEVVQVSSDLDRVVHALQLISAQLRANPPRQATPVSSSGGGPGGVALMTGMTGPGTAAGGRSDAAQVPLGGECMDTKFQILVAAARAGAIIGRHGDQVNALRRETGAMIKVYEAAAGADERVVEVRSTDDIAAPYCAAQEAVLRIGAALLSEGEVHTLRLLVPAAQVGGLVGKGGMRIRTIRQETGTDVRVTSGNSGSALVTGAGGGTPSASPSRSTSSGLEIVEINGPPVPCLHALKTVTSVLRVCQAREQRKRMLPATSPPTGLFNPMGALGGLSATAVLAGLGPLGAHPHHPPHPALGPGAPHHLQHHPHPAVSLVSALQASAAAGVGGLGGGALPLSLSLGGAAGGGSGSGISPPNSRGALEGLAPGMVDDHGAGVMALMGGGGPGVGGPGVPGAVGAFSLGGLPALRTAAAGGASGGSGSLRVTIPKEQVGAVLGHGGSNIQQIRALSGAKVKLHDSDAAAPGAARQLEISGSFEQLQAAQGLLQAFLTAAQAGAS